MKRTTRLFLGTTALLVAGAVALPLGAADAGPKRVHLVLTETSTGFHFVDAPAATEDGQVGDLITFASDLSNASGKVGSLEGHCVQLHADGSLDDCEVTVIIGSNSFRMAGLFNPATGSPLTVLGGTGAWVGIGGVDSIVNQPDGTAIHTIDLVKL